MKFKFEELKLPLLPSEDISERAKMFIAISLVKQILLRDYECGCTPDSDWEDFKSTLKKGIYEYLGDIDVNRSALNRVLDLYITELLIYSKHQVDRDFLYVFPKPNRPTELWSLMVLDMLTVLDDGFVVVRGSLTETINNSLEFTGDEMEILNGGLSPKHFDSAVSNKLSKDNRGDKPLKNTFRKPTFREKVKRCLKGKFKDKLKNW